VVVFDGSVAEPGSLASSLSRRLGFEVTHVYRYALEGFAAELTREDVTVLRSIQRVDFVARDRVAEASGQAVPAGIKRIDAPQSSTAAGDGSGEVNADIAILDTGIYKQHKDLNITSGVDCSGRDTGAWGDGDGHGTHVAGAAAAKDNDIGVVGVAPGTPLYDVRIGNDSGAILMSGALCGLDWVVQHAAGSGIKVANLSFAGAAVAADQNPCGPTTTALHNAICSMVAAGVATVAAAGNGSTDANTAVPATYNEVTTVSALVDSDGCTGGKGKSTPMGPDDTRSTESNFGADVDVAAPGVRITSTVPMAQTSYNGYRRLSGTSMATPHVAAAIALGWSGSEETRKGLPEGILKLSAYIGC